MKYFYSFVFIVICFQLFSSNRFEDGIISIDSPSSLNIESIEKKVLIENGKHYLQSLYSVEIKGKDELIYFRLSYPIKKYSHGPKVLSLIGKDEIEEAYSVYGMGRVLDVAEMEGFYMLNENTERFIASWGSATTRDILLYRLSIDHKVFSECLVEVFNLWPKEVAIPYDLSNDNLELLLENDTSTLQIYNIFDEIFSEKFEIMSDLGIP